MANLKSAFISFIFVYLYIYIGVVSGQPVQDSIPLTKAIAISKKQTISEVTNGSNIKTVLLNRTDLELAYPTILLGSSDAIQLSFDDLKGGVNNYYYTFEHCNQQWESSNLSAYDFLDGFEENRISEYSFSFATLQKYTHYSIVFPNNDIQFRLSGNYVIKIWEEDNRETPVIVKRFFVWEKQVAITANVYRPNLIPFRNEYQEINFTLDVKNADISSAYDEVSVTLMQNGRYDNAQYSIKPRMITNDMLYYDIDNIVFPGGKEYRRFDTKTLKFQSDRIRKIEKDQSGYQVYINVDESRIFQQYFYEKDANGQYVIRADLANNVNTESDYAWVNFVLQYPYVITSGDVYIFGSLSDMQFRLDNKMEYDYDKQQYTAKLYLKQGYYNYMYATLPINGSIAELTLTEGNSYESENDYQLFIYKRDFNTQYDRIIGCSMFNSMRR